mmetsp:Transcript_12453/g.20423  ORF Transcript_12453/g.20423 Transcript_12453/m.20423 type:complete len:179 (-) Transcript_12453:164-700(-)|eukprot:CAMPEP_0169130788 /NCGR_PEP_ID=MMETSP1015-20121227/37896_1 /TAXON_ID=342587 /ORGANISM="Karlodinium micrum, Strain CCMP2283" /LENGTH=178 /DNA_ID=CAMNT_0009194997 /DNA_START=90 /DNA_END=626 /DNA_ORIENTATION=+
MARSVSCLALPPEHYGPPKGRMWHGVKEEDRFPPTYPEHEEAFAEYMSHPSMSPSRHEASLAKSTGLLELHYNTMRKKQKDRSKAGQVVSGPTMHRPFTAMAGYGGFIPGKLSNNVCGCTFAQGSRLSKELRPLSAAGSGMVVTLGSRSKSLTAFGATGASLSSSLGDNAYGLSMKTL